MWPGYDPFEAVQTKQRGLPLKSHYKLREDICSTMQNFALGRVECLPLNQPKINYFYSLFFFIVQLQTDISKSDSLPHQWDYSLPARLDRLFDCVFACWLSCQIDKAIVSCNEQHFRSSWLLLLLDRTCLFYCYRLEGQDLSPESSRLLKFLDVYFTTSQYAAIAEAERNQE